MVELRQGYKFTLLHLTFGLLQERAFLPRDHSIGIDHLFRFDDQRTSMLFYSSDHALRVSDSQKLWSPMLAREFQ
jgi:hypothetical protein